MRKVLPTSFFNRPTLTVARQLLGKYLLRRIGNRLIAAKITEVEAYDGPGDRASHAARGKTARNRVMFGEAGRWYVYFVYGMHWMLNVVTGPKGYPAAVLIRGTDAVSGPARITKKFLINSYFNGRRAARKTTLWFENRGVRISPHRIIRLPRVGVSYAGPTWAHKRYRFLLRT